MRSNGAEAIRAMVEGLAAPAGGNPGTISRAGCGWPGHDDGVWASPKPRPKPWPQPPATRRKRPARSKPSPWPRTEQVSANGVPVIDADAVELFQRALALAPGDAEIHWYLGLYAVQNDDPAGAREAWSQVLELLAPDDPNAELIRRSLEALPANKGNSVEK